MRIAVFSSGYLPGEKYGGPVTSIYNFTELLGDDNDIYIVCLNHDLMETTPYSGIKPGWNRVGKARVFYLSDKKYKKGIFSEILDEISPHFIYISSIFSWKQTYPLFVLSKQKNIPILLAPRGELNSRALEHNHLKKKIYLVSLKLLRKMTTSFFQATSEEEKKDIIQNIGVDERKVFLLPNIPTIPERKRLLSKTSGQLSMCFVGRIVENKNLLFAIRAASLSSTKIKFDIFGTREDEEYFDKCKKVIENSHSELEVSYKGVLSPFLMKKEYSKYDCLISPTQFENYGQSIVEAMLHDVPVIISKGTTPWDDVCDFGAGFVNPLTDELSFAKSIEVLASMNSMEYEALITRLREYCSKKFNHYTLKRRYYEVFNQIIAQGDKKHGTVR